MYSAKAMGENFDEWSTCTQNFDEQNFDRCEGHMSSNTK